MAANSIKCRNPNLFILMIKFFNYFFEGEEKKKMKLADNVEHFGKLRMDSKLCGRIEAVYAKCMLVECGFNACVWGSFV